MSVWDDIVGSVPLVGPVLNTVSSALGMGGSAHYQRVNMRESARLQHDENVYWAEYNTPSNQMARLAQAGLNPNLVYGSGADAQFKGEVSPSGGMPNSNFRFGTDMMNLATAVQNLKNLKSQRDLTQASTAKEFALADEATKRAEGLAIDNEGKREYGGRAQAAMRRDQEYQNYLNTIQERDRLHSQVLLNDAQTSWYTVQKNILNEYGYQLKDQELQQSYLKTAIMEIEKNNLPQKLQAELNLTRSQSDEIVAKIANIKALTDLYETQTDVEQKKITEQSIRNSILELEKTLKKNEVDVKTNGLAKFMDSYVRPITGSVGDVLGVTTKF